MRVRCVTSVLTSDHGRVWADSLSVTRMDVVLSLGSPAFSPADAYPNCLALNLGMAGQACMRHLCTTRPGFAEFRHASLHIIHACGISHMLSHSNLTSTQREHTAHFQISFHNQTYDQSPSTVPTLPV